MRTPLLLWDSLLFELLRYVFALPPVRLFTTLAGLPRLLLFAVLLLPLLSFAALLLSTFFGLAFLLATLLRSALISFAVFHRISILDCT